MRRLSKNRLLMTTSKHPSCKPEFIKRQTLPVPVSSINQQRANMIQHLTLQDTADFLKCVVIEHTTDLGHSIVQIENMGRMLGD